MKYALKYVLCTAFLCITCCAYAQEKTAEENVLIPFVELKWHSREYSGGTYPPFAFSPNGKWIAVKPEWYSPVKILDADTGKELQTLGEEPRKLGEHYSTTNNILSIAFSSDSKYLATAGSERTGRRSPSLLAVVQIWDIETGKELHKIGDFEGSILYVAFSPDGKLIVTASIDGKTPQNRDGINTSRDASLRVWEVDTGKELHKLEVPGNWFTSVAFSPDGERILAGCVTHSVEGEVQTFSIRIWERDTHKEILKLESDGRQGGISEPVFSPDGKRVAAIRTNYAGVWDVETSKAILFTWQQRGSVLAVAFSPDGKWIATGSRDRTVRFWDANTGLELHLLKGHTDEIFALSFSSDGKRIATASGDETIRIWDISTLTEP